MAEILPIRRKILSIQSVNILKYMYRRENDRWSRTNLSSTIKHYVFGHRSKKH